MYMSFEDEEKNLKFTANASTDKKNLQHVIHTRLNTCFIKHVFYTRMFLTSQTVFNMFFKQVLYTC